MIFALFFLLSIFSYKIFGIKMAGITLFLDRIILPVYIILNFNKIFFYRNLYKKGKIFFPIILLVIVNVFLNISMGNLNVMTINLKFLVVIIEWLLFFYIFSVLQNKKKFIQYYFYFTILIFVFGIFEYSNPTIISDIFYELFPMTIEQKENIFQLFFRGDKIRISLFSTHALAYGTLISLHIPFIISQFFNISKKVFILNFILANINLYLSFSRAATLTIILLYMYIISKILLKNRSHIEVILKLFILVIFIILLSYAILKIDWKLFFPEGKNDISISMRLEDYKNIFSFSHNNILFGTFGDTYLTIYDDAVDNYFLNFFFSYGLIGALCLLFFFIQQFILILNSKNKYMLIIFYQIIFYNITFDFFGFLEMAKYYFLILGILGTSEDYKKNKEISNGCYNNNGKL